MLGWIKHKLESRLQGETSITSDMQMTPPFGRKQRGAKEPLDEDERGEWKSWLQTQHLKNKDHGIWSHLFQVNRWGTMETVTDFILGGSKITAGGDCSHEIKGCLFLGRQLIKKQRYYFANKGLSSQSYGFSSSHVWMWELDYKESWALKNWCFWTVVLENAGVQPQWIQGDSKVGMELASLEITYLITDREGLEN